MGGLNYVYAVLRPSGEPCYIGKGSGPRWKRHRARARVNAHYAAILAQAGGVLPVVMIATGLTEHEAFALERDLTLLVRIESAGGPLVNCGHGGRGGPRGIVRSPEFRAIRSKRAAEAWLDEGFRTRQLSAERHRAGNRQPRTAAFKGAVSEKLKGNVHTLGYRHSDEARAKMSADRKGKPKSPDHRAKLQAHLARMAADRREARA